jgi:hypothetical protein
MPILVHDVEGFNGLEIEKEKQLHEQLFSVFSSISTTLQALFFFGSPSASQPACNNFPI